MSNIKCTHLGHNTDEINQGMFTLRDSPNKRILEQIKDRILNKDHIKETQEIKILDISINPVSGETCIVYFYVILNKKLDKEPKDMSID